MLAEAAQGLVRRDALVTGDAVGGAELEGVQLLNVLEEALVVGVPAQCAGGEQGPLVAGAELGRAVRTGGECDQVAVVEAVVKTHKAGDELGFRQPVGNAVQFRVTGLEVFVAQGLVHEVHAREGG